MKYPFSSSCRNAFSLVELLVVMSIVAVVIALLLPALKKARAQARKLQCTTNLRTLNSTALVYATDFKSYGPPTAAAAGTEENALNWLVGSDATATFPEFLGLDSYLGFRVSRNTADRPYNARKFYWSAKGCPDSAFQVNSPPFAANERILNLGSPSTWIRLDNIRIPSNTILDMECNNRQTIPELWRLGGANGITTTVLARHDAYGLNMGFIDGHVDFRLFNWTTNLFYNRPITLNGTSDAGL